MDRARASVVRLLTAVLLAGTTFLSSQNKFFSFSALLCGVAVLAALQGSTLTSEARLKRLREKQLARVAGLFSRDSMQSISVEGDPRSTIARLVTVENVSKTCLAGSLCYIAYRIGS